VKWIAIGLGSTPLDFYFVVGRNEIGSINLWTQQLNVFMQLEIAGIYALTVSLITLKYLQVVQAECTGGCVESL
jgi:hypothetical protein